MVRSGLVAHAVTLGVLLLFLGLIHVAPLGATPRTPTGGDSPQHKSFIRVDAVPWARVSLDGKLVGITPFAKPLDAFDGTHTLRFEHDWYQPIEQQIEITTNPIERAQSFSVDFEKQGTLVLGKHKPVSP